jgi:hypothetical protein
MGNADSSWKGCLSNLMEPAAPGAATKPIRKLLGQRWDSSVRSSVQSSEDVFHAQSSFSLSASAITFKG